jgi:hypothetical protein
MKKNALFILIILVTAACNNNGANNQKEEKTASTATVISKGDSIVKITFDTLSNTLVKTIAAKGLSGALVFCNVQAATITSIYASAGISVSRVTDKTRNAKNALTDFDKIEWDKYKTLLTNKDSIKPVVIFRNNEQHYYKPILVQTMCLNCHGTPGKEIPKDLLPVIDSLYPSDRAKGYKEGDLRGMWHVVLTNK